MLQVKLPLLLGSTAVDRSADSSLQQHRPYIIRGPQALDLFKQLRSLGEIAAQVYQPLF